MRKINWTLAIAAIALAAQGVSVVWAVGQIVGEANLKIAVVQNDITHIAKQQDDQGSKIDFLYREYVTANFATASGRSP